MNRAFWARNSLRAQLLEQPAEFVPTVSTNTIWFGFKYIRDQLAEVGGVFAEKLEGVLAVFGEIRGGGPVWDVESGGTVCVLVADCQWPQSRARLKPETMRVTFEEFSPTHDYFDYRGLQFRSSSPLGPSDWPNNASLPADHPAAFNAELFEAIPTIRSFQDFVNELAP